MTERNYWQRMRRKQMSRRALLRASGRAGVGAAGLALVGCGDDDDDDQQSAAQAAGQQQQQQQAMQQQRGQQQQQQQAMQQQGQQGQQDAAAESQADQADKQEQSADDAQEQQQAVAADIVRGGTLRFSTPAATHDYFDPHRAVFGPTQFWMGFYMNYLIRWRNKEEGILESDVASLPETPDEETYIFSIDRGARFWDQYPTEGGRLVTAQDIEVNFQRQIDAADSTGAEDSTYLGASAFRKTASMETPDETTFIAKTDGIDATYLGSPVLRPFSWITSPEAISEYGDRWRDEAGNVELSSGTGPFIPLTYDPDLGLDMTRNDNYWKIGADGQPLPYMDNVGMKNLTDPTAVETAYRSREIDVGGFPLSTLQADEISTDFPDHPQGQIAFGFTIITGIFNYNPDWPGEDGLGNPYLDRRFCYALHLAVDRYLMIDAVYLGSGKPSGQEHTPWFNQYWAIPEEELLSTPGYRPDRDADIADARAALDASGYDKDRKMILYAPDIWEQTYQGILETEKNMYEEALGIEIEFNIQPYTVLLQRWVSKTYPGGGPQWTNPPDDLDPTTSYLQNLTPGGATNNLSYEFQPMTDIANKMRVTLDREERREMAFEAQRILLGTHPDHGVEGLGFAPAVMNGISPALWWPYVQRPADTLQFAHASHRYDEGWVDVNHPDYPA
ncbi:MAG: ABC transporter substrate-binding protein [Chloroflexota bacterium]|nr:ABC transporter substrate-binding protein [Chloroflexota bacterium]MDE2894863.1 ABC transporter substrate-binding protein [Chloroflexota bacterium]